jgi:tricorn protease
VKDREKRKIADKVDAYALSGDGSHLVYRSGKKITIAEANGRFRGDRGSRDEDERFSKDHGPFELDLSEVKVLLDPRAEWRQIFDEAWRMERDFYYEPNLHGIDWPAMREKYGRLIDRASCRQDVRYVIGELIGELNTSHTYVFGGDARREAESIDVGMLGVDWSVDANSGRFRIEKIYRVPDWTQEVLPPLARPGVDARVGDYLLRVDGVDATADRNVYSYFQNLAGRQVTLVLNDRPEEQGARKVTVEPLGTERTLRYLDWVEHNRRVVDEASNGRIGYLHLPDTYNRSAREFPKYYYAQTRKDGLIVDGRFNAGGLDPAIFLERLARKPLAYFTRRYSHDQTIPPVVNSAYLAMLTNRQAGSGGDMLPMEFQMEKLGPVIGTRTWGGLVGVSMWIDLVDGGGMSAPDYRIYDRQGHWIVENEGITPDIEVDLQSAEMARGHDAQLMKAIDVLMKEIEAKPPRWPEHEPFPVDRR